MRTALAAVIALALAVLLPLAAPASVLAEDGTNAGEPERLFQISDERVTESSGLTMSTVHDDIMYTHNDSGHDPQVYAVDADGAVVATLELRETDSLDWEAIASGPDSRIWVGDIGDNPGDRDEITLFRFREPVTLTDQSLMWSRFRLQYEDGPHDAEAILVHPQTSQIFVVTKSADGGAIYAGPEQLSGESVNTLTRVSDAPSLVTGGSFLPDGSGIVLRTYTKGHVFEYPSWEPQGELPMPLQPQGESLTVTRDQEAVLVGSEGPNSWIYSVPLAAMADEVEEATPSPTPTDESRDDPATEEDEGDEDDDDEGGIISSLESSLGGIPVWIPAAAIGIALLAGVATFPRAKRPPPPPANRPPPPANRPPPQTTG